MKALGSHSFFSDLIGSKLQKPKALWSPNQFPEAGSFPGKIKEGILGPKGGLGSGPENQGGGGEDGQGAGKSGQGSGSRLWPPAPPGDALSRCGPASSRQGLGAGPGLVGWGPGRVPAHPEECGLWLVPRPHSGPRWNVNSVSTARPERTSSVPSRWRTPGSGSGGGPPLCHPPEPVARAAGGQGPDGCQASGDSTPATRVAASRPDVV